MPYSTAVSRDIDAPAHDVFALVSDLTRMGEWSPENTGGKWVKGSTGPALGAVVIAVCDQPFVSAALFASLAERHVATGISIVASAYAGSVGTPVLFAASQFPALLALAGDAGAKKIILQQEAALVDFPEGGLDIDTDAAYAELLARGSGR